MKIKISVFALLAALMLVIIFALTPGIFQANGASERIANGGFEEGFAPDGLAKGWARFDNGGAGVVYGWHDDAWAPVVYEGKYSQLIEINTLNFSQSQHDRYSGIYQTIAVAPGATYQFSLWGMLRVRGDDSDVAASGYRVHFGYDPTGGTDWTKVTNWVDMNFEKITERKSPGAFQNFKTTLTATGNRLTVFIRAWKKWPSLNRELDFNVDAISLSGPAPADLASPQVTLQAPDFMTTGRAASLTVKASNDVGVKSIRLTANGATIGLLNFTTGPLAIDQVFSWTPAAAGNVTLQATVTDMAGKTASASQTVKVGASVELIRNGNFEGGFTNGVGNNWSGFTNGGANTKYTFMDDTWAPVVYEGRHSQLLEINSFGFAAGDWNRYIGICQNVSGLTAGASYQLTVRGWMRTQPDDPDASAYGYILQYGADMAARGDWTLIENWADLNIGKTTPRLSPASSAGTATAWITPTGANMTLCLRVWKKFPSANREVDVNLDGVSLAGYK